MNCSSGPVSLSSHDAPAAPLGPDPVRAVPRRDLWGIPTDKIVHFLMFFPFPILACLASGGYRGERWQATFRTVIAFLAGCAFAAATEWVQTWLSYRSGDPVDFGADALAILLSSAIVLIIVLAKHRK